MVRPVSTEPLHAKVANELRRRIGRGQLPVGASLPSEAQLCAEFGSSRGTIRQALATLRHEGLIGGGQGRPAMVRSTAAAQPFETFLSFTRWAELIGRAPGQRTVEIARRAASPAAADALGIVEGTPVIDVVRVRLLDGQPAMLERSSYLEPIGRLLFDCDPDAGSIYAYLLDHGVDIHTIRHTVDAVGADPADAHLLDVAPGAPLLRERRRAAARDGSPIEFGDDRYRPDLVNFTIDNTRTGPHVLKEMS